LTAKINGFPMLISPF